MAKTWYGHHIETIKGENYVLLKDYNELDKKVDKLNYIINELEKHFETLKLNSTGGNKEFMEDVLLFIKELKFRVIVNNEKHGGKELVA